MPTTKKVTSDKKQETNKKAVKTEKETAEAVILSGVEGSVKTKKIATSPSAPRNDKKSGGLSVAMYSLLGKESGSLDLPKAVFGAEINRPLLAQALRVYLNNQKGHFSNTKTRGEVEGSTRKIYNQKGTGRARHGGIRAPIFVGGGIALGPKSRQALLELPKKMKKAALISALSQKHLDKDIYGVSGLEKATGKTSEIMKFVTSNKLSSNVTSKQSLPAKAGKKASILIIGDKMMENIERATGNIKGVNFLSADQLNTLEIIKTQSLFITKEAVDALEKRILKPESGTESRGTRKENSK